MTIADKTVLTTGANRGDLSGTTTLVVGASRGLGRGIALAFAETGAPVVAVARSAPALADLATAHTNIRTEVADATDPTVAWSLLDRYEPEVLVLVAGANPVMRPLQHQTWETFSVNWHTDVKIAFTWLREALLKPLATRQPSRRGEQRRRAQRIAGQRRLRRCQGHPAIPRRLRAGRVASRRAGRHRHRGHAEDDAVRRRRPTGRSRLRGPRRP